MLYKDILDRVNKACTSIENMEKMLIRHDEILFGRGHKDNPGMVIDVDRLNVHKADTQKTAWAVWLTAVGLVIKYVWDFLTAGHK